jgi:hypothetical protein
MRVVEKYSKKKEEHDNKIERMYVWTRNKKKNEERDKKERKSERE